VSGLGLALAAGAASAQVTAEALKPLDLWSAGGRDTGLGADLWRGASPELARSVLDGLADKPVSPALAALARRVLQTGANAPDGAGSDTALAAARVRALIALGALAGAEGVLSSTPHIEASEGLSHAQAELQLLAGHDGDACETGRALQEGRDGAWWLKLRAYCSLVDKQPAAAQVTLDLWRQGGGKAPAFERLMNAAVSGGDAGKASLDDPLVLALSRRLNLDLSTAAGAASAATTVALARDPATPRPLRLQATARALRLGAVPLETVRDLYAAPTAEAAAPADPAALAADASAAGEAGLYALAAQTSDPAVKETAIAALLGRARSNADFQALARLVAPRLADLVQAGVAPKDPVLFAAASAAAGDAATAAAIRAGIKAESGVSPLDLALLDALIDVAAGKTSEPVLDRLIERGSTGDAKARSRAQAAAELMAVRGAALPPKALGELAGFEVAPGKASAARTTALRIAAAQGLPGETALIALAIGLQQPTGPGPADRAAIIPALARAGLARDASDLTLEGLIALMGK
jgi:hypothetical protein